MIHSIQHKSKNIKASVMLGRGSLYVEHEHKSQKPLEHPVEHPSVQDRLNAAHDDSIQSYRFERHAPKSALPSKTTCLPDMIQRYDKLWIDRFNRLKFASMHQSAQPSITDRISYDEANFYLERVAQSPTEVLMGRDFRVKFLPWILGRLGHVAPSRQDDFIRLIDGYLQCTEHLHVVCQKDILFDHIESVIGQISRVDMDMVCDLISRYPNIVQTHLRQKDKDWIKNSRFSDWLNHSLQHVFPSTSSDVAEVVDGLGKLQFRHNRIVCKSIAEWISASLFAMESPSLQDVGRISRGIEQLNLIRTSKVSDCFYGWFLRQLDLIGLESAQSLRLGDLLMLLDRLPTVTQRFSRFLFEDQVYSKLHYWYSVHREHFDSAEISPSVQRQLFRLMHFWGFESPERWRAQAYPIAHKEAIQKAWELEIGRMLNVHVEQWSREWEEQLGIPIPYQMIPQWPVKGSDYTVDWLLTLADQRIALEFMGELYHAPFEPVRDNYIIRCVDQVIKIWAKDWECSNVDTLQKMKEQLWDMISTPSTSRIDVSSL